MTPQELLLKTADDVERLGHWKYTYWEPGKPELEAPACAYGAFTRAATGTTCDYVAAEDLSDAETIMPLISRAAALLADKITDDELEGLGVGQHSGTFVRVSKYNDRPATTGTQLAAKMREAAES